MTDPAALPFDTLKLAFDLAPVGLCVSQNRVIQRCNEAFAAMFGYSVDRLDGESMAILYPSQQEFENVGARGYQAMLETGHYTDERIMRHADGRMFWCHVAGRSLDRSSPFACAVWMFEDISARRPANLDLTRREREVAQFLVTGQSSKQIAKHLNISPRTVEAHRARLMGKLGVSSAPEMIARLIGAV